MESFAERVKERSSIVLTGAERRGVGNTGECEHYRKDIDLALLHRKFELTEKINN